MCGDCRLPNQACQQDECEVWGGPGILPGFCNCDENLPPDGECDCSGNTLDECGECGGGGIDAGECDCDHNVLDECGECGGDGIDAGECDCDHNVLDRCDVCGGANECLDQCDVPHGTDECLDDCGVPNGYNECFDACGVPNGDNSTCLDSCGVVNGDNACLTEVEGNLPCPGGRSTHDYKFLVADSGNNRIQGCPGIMLECVTLAGGNDKGDASNQFRGPTFAILADNGDLIVSDSQNYRVQRCPADCTSVCTTEAGGNGPPPNVHQFPNTTHMVPWRVRLAADGEILVLDRGKRILKCPGAGGNCLEVYFRAGDPGEARIADFALSNTGDDDVFLGIMEGGSMDAQTKLERCFWNDQNIGECTVVEALDKYARAPGNPPRASIAKLEVSPSGDLLTVDNSYNAQILSCPPDGGDCVRVFTYPEHGYGGDGFKYMAGDLGWGPDDGAMYALRANQDVAIVKVPDPSVYEWTPEAGTDYGDGPTEFNGPNSISVIDTNFSPRLEDQPLCNPTTFEYYGQMNADCFEGANYNNNYAVDPNNCITPRQLWLIWDTMNPGGNVPCSSVLNVAVAGGGCRINQEDSTETLCARYMSDPTPAQGSWAGGFGPWRLTYPDVQLNTIWSEGMPEHCGIGNPCCNARYAYNIIQHMCGNAAPTDVEITHPDGAPEFCGFNDYTGPGTPPDDDPGWAELGVTPTPVQLWTSYSTNVNSSNAYEYGAAFACPINDA